MISTILRILGILDDTVNVVVVPTSVWHRMQDERNEALERVRVLEVELAIAKARGEKP
jgi:hypothetical protein